MISAKVLNASIDENGNLKVATEYTLTDGSKQTGHTRYSAQNFSKDKILEDVKSQCENLMRKTWNLKQNQVLKDTKVDDITYSCESVELVTKPEIKDLEGKITQAKESITIDDK
jgi:hypothetical protein